MKSDLFSSFIVRIMGLANDHGECGIMCPFVWMFIGSYEKLRNEIIDNRTFTSLIQLEYSGFAGATVPICTFTFHNSHVDGYKGGYIRLSDFAGAAKQAPKALEAIKNPDCGWFYRRDADTFKQIPGTPIAYWASDALLEAFKEEEIGDVCLLRTGMKTGDNNRFLRLWWEPSRLKEKMDSANDADAIESGMKWFPYNKGGEYRKWFGNNDWVVNFENDGSELLGDAASDGRHIQNLDKSLRFKPSLTWSLISSGSIAFRFRPSGSLYDMAGMSMFPVCLPNFVLGLANSSFSLMCLSFLAPTLNYQVGDISRIPYVGNIPEPVLGKVNGAVQDSIDLSMSDWDSFETSWDFKRHSLV
ncbi:MAG: hypothetical protein U0I00_06025 [Eggerthellaceae bacterium]|nr:hypothetical protein [Eggerthellaceae bacterium]